MSALKSTTETNQFPQKKETTSLLQLLCLLTGDKAQPGLREKVFLVWNCVNQRWRDVVLIFWDGLLMCLDNVLILWYDGLIFWDDVLIFWDGVLIFQF